MNTCSVKTVHSRACLSHFVQFVDRLLLGTILFIHLQGEGLVVVLRRNVNTYCCSVVCAVNVVWIIDNYYWTCYCLSLCWMNGCLLVIHGFLKDS